MRKPVRSLRPIGANFEPAMRRSRIGRVGTTLTLALLFFAGGMDFANSAETACSKGIRCQAGCNGIGRPGDAAQTTCFRRCNDAFLDNCKAERSGVEMEMSNPPGRSPKPKSAGNVTAPSHSNPTTTRPQGPQQVTPRPESNPTPRGPVLR